MYKSVKVSCFFPTGHWSNQNQIAPFQVELPLDDEEPEAEGCESVAFSIIPAIMALLCFDHSYLGLSLVGIFESIDHYANCTESSVCRYCRRMHHTVVLCCRQDDYSLEETCRNRLRHSAISWAPSLTLFGVFAH